MSDIKPGDKVRVNIGNQVLEGVYQETVDGLRLNYQVQFLSDSGAGWSAIVPPEWVVPVTSPSPWTEVGTVVRTDPGVDGSLTGSLYELTADGWWRMGIGETPVDYATDIAPFNPVRLVPEQPTDVVAQIRAALLEIPASEIRRILTEIGGAS